MRKLMEKMGRGALAGIAIAAVLSATVLAYNYNQSIWPHTDVGGSGWVGELVGSYWHGAIPADLGSPVEAVIDVYCLDHNETAITGQEHQPDTTTQVADEMQWILSHFYPETSGPSIPDYDALGTNLKAKCVQEAVWVLQPGDGFDMANVSANVYDCVDALITAAQGAQVPTTLALSPSSATNLKGTSHTVTALLTDQGGAAIPDTDIEFTVAGANSAGPWTGTTGASGEVDFTYTGSNPGDDTITAVVEDGVPRSWVWYRTDSQHLVKGEPEDLSTGAAKQWCEGTITIVKDVICGGVSGCDETADDFAFTSASLGNFILDDDGSDDPYPSSESFPNLGAGTYVITEDRYKSDADWPWALQAVDCGGAVGVTAVTDGDGIQKGVQIELTDCAPVQCTFVNEYVGTTAVTVSSLEASSGGVGLVSLVWLMAVLGLAPLAVGGVLVRRGD
jgi:hypothetical protein